MELGRISEQQWVKGLPGIIEGPALICNNIQKPIWILSWCRNEKMMIRLMYVLGLEYRFRKRKKYLRSFWCSRETVEMINHR